jgi:hypothetical protein
MTTLGELADVVKSANAGATWLTLEIGITDPVMYRRATEAEVLAAESIATLYGVPTRQVAVYHCDAIQTIKVTLPRAVLDGGAAETDFDGTQQFVPLLGLVVADADA